MFLWNIAVTSLAEVWIEILVSPSIFLTSTVTSLAEVWIEIDSPVPERHPDYEVTSLAEVWIEIPNSVHIQHTGCVTSLAEVWIEIVIIILVV